MEKDRIIRVNDNLKKEIATFIQNSNLKNSCGFISINHVETARDLSSARVFFSTINSELSNKDLQKYLNDNAWMIRKGLSGILPLKRVPELKFIYDAHIDNVRKMDDLIEKL